MLIISPFFVPYIFIKFFDKINQNLPHCMLTLRLRLLFTFGFVNLGLSMVMATFPYCWRTMKYAFHFKLRGSLLDYCCDK